MAPPLFVCFHTTDAYADEARELQKTLDAFGLPSDILPVPPFDTWVQGCGFKPRFIQMMMTKHAGRPLVWLDADARVVRHPEAFEHLQEDFAAHWLGDCELLSGTLYFAPTANAATLVDRWAGKCADRPFEWDQVLLNEAVADAADLRVFGLPPEYTWIAAPGVAEDISARMYGADRQPVIVHTQASRRLRKG